MCKKNNPKMQSVKKTYSFVYDFHTICIWRVKNPLSFIIIEITLHQQKTNELTI